MNPGMLIGRFYPITIPQCQLGGISDAEIASEERAVYLCVYKNSFVVALRASDRVLGIVRAFCEGRRNGGKENGG